VRVLAAKEKPALLDTLKALVSIESGSATSKVSRRSRISLLRDCASSAAGSRWSSRAISTRWRIRADHLGKMVRATFTGTGSKKILLIAHMDNGLISAAMLEKQPFRNRRRPPLWARHRRDKHGIAVILHTIRDAKALDGQRRSARSPC